MSFSIKVLEWRSGYRDETVTIFQASFGGMYQVRVLDGEIWLDWPDRPATQFPNIEAAKAAAQADFEARIRAALQSSPPVKAAAVDGEIDRLRKALIAAGRHVGAGLADDVSTDFLMLVPEEVRLVMERHRAALASQAAVEGGRNARLAAEMASTPKAS